MASAGRPLKFDEKQRRILTNLLSEGCGIEMLARVFECTERTIKNTMDRNELFIAPVQEAPPIATASLIAKIRAAANEPRHWRAAAWVLERLQPDHFAQRPPHTLSVAGMNEFVAEILKAVGEVAGPEAIKRIEIRSRELRLNLLSDVEAVLETSFAELHETEDQLDE